MTVKSFYKRVIPYVYMDGPDKGRGTITDELQTIWNQMEDMHQDTEYLDSSQTVAGQVIVKAIKEFQEKIDVLNARIDELETELYGESE